MKSAILNLYKSYWKVFLVFIPIALLFFQRSGSDINARATIYSYASRKDLLSAIICDFIGYRSSLNHEWWFFGSYVCAIPMGYLFCRAIRKISDFWTDLFISFGVVILLTAVFPALTDIEAFQSLSSNALFSWFLTPSSYIGSLFVGIVIAKYDGIGKIKCILQDIPFCTVISILGICAVLWCRTFVMSGMMDIVYCIFLTAMASIVFDRLKPLKRLFIIFGKHSTNMWLIHGFFVYYFLEITQIVYATSSVFVDFIILVGLSLLASFLLNCFYTGLGKLLAKSKVLLPLAP